MDKVFIIAEAGVNHNGSVRIAKKLINAAIEAGADAVKFQTFKAQAVVSRYAPKAMYQEKNTDTNESHLEMLKNLELNEEAHRILVDYCKHKGIIFLSSPFDLKSIDLLNKLNLKIFKIPSGEITNLPYLKKIGSLRKQIIMSTGMSNLKEVREALDILTACGSKKENITILHCNTEYPTPTEDVNLKAMLTIRDAFNIKVGYSDHTPGIEVPIAAVALGASVIEKHFTLDTNMEGPDHKASLNPADFKAMVGAIRNIEKALGEKTKRPSLSESKNMPIARKSIVASRGIGKGEKFTEGNITVKRPGTGISPMKWHKVIGRISRRDFQEDELIEL